MSALALRFQGGLAPKTGDAASIKPSSPSSPQKSLRKAAISIVLLPVGKGNACVHRALLP
jgi:hypothetical protein